MLRPLAAAVAATIIILAACDDADEYLPSNQISPTPTAIGDSITICGRVGIAGEATPSSPTPEASCEPGDDYGSEFTSMGPGIRGRILQNPPPLPGGLIALTRFMEIETDEPDIEARIALPLVERGPSPLDLTPVWYTYDSGEWLALEAGPTIRYSLATDTSLAEGHFDPVPHNLILLDHE